MTARDVAIVLIQCLRHSRRNLWQHWKPTQKQTQEKRHWVAPMRSSYWISANVINCCGTRRRTTATDRRLCRLSRRQTEEDEAQHAVASSTARGPSEDGCRPRGERGPSSSRPKPGMTSSLHLKVFHQGFMSTLQNSSIHSVSRRISAKHISLWEN